MKFVISNPDTPMVKDAFPQYSTELFESSSPYIFRLTREKKSVLCFGCTTYIGKFLGRPPLMSVEMATENKENIHK